MNKSDRTADRLRGKKLRYRFFLVFLAVGLVILAQPKNGATERKEGTNIRVIRLSLSDVLLRTLENSPAIKAVGYAIKSAAQEVLFEKGVFDPVIFGEAGYSNQEYPVSDVITGMNTEKIQGKAGIKKKLLFGTEIEAGTEGNRLLTDAPIYLMRPEYRQKFYVSVVQPLLRGAGINANAVKINLAKAQADRRFHDGHKTLIDLLYDTSKAYWDLYENCEKLDAALTGLKMAEQLYHDASLKFKEGVGPRSDVMQAYAELQHRLANVIVARQNRIQSEITLKRVMAISEFDRLWDAKIEVLDNPVRVNDGLTFKDLLDAARRFNPAIQTAQVDIIEATSRKAWASNLKKPKLDIESSIAVHGLSGSDKDGKVPDKFIGGYGHGYDNVFDYPEWYIGAKFEMPIFNSQGKARYSQAVYDLHAAQLRKRAAVVDSYGLIREILPRFDALVSEIEARKAAVRYKKIQHEDEVYRYENGMGSLYDALKMQSEYTDELSELATARARYMSSVAEIMKITGEVRLEFNKQSDL